MSLDTVKAFQYKNNRNKFFKYKSVDDVEIGDVVRFEDDIGSQYAAFSDCIVAQITNSMVHLERPHLKVQKLIDRSTSVYVTTERFCLETYIFIERYVCYVTGNSSNKDNRSFL